MKSIVTLAALLVSLGAWAAEPPDSDKTPQPNTPPKNEVQGALIIENQPAVPPESLESKTEEKKSETQKSPASTSSGRTHHFGLHASLGLPHPINYGLNYVHSSGLWSVELSTGSFKHTIDDVDAKLDNMEIGLRWHPWAGAFFAGALVGNQTVTAEKTDEISIYGDVTAEGKVKANYITPHVGWMWGAEDGGFFASFEIGYQSPSNVKVDITSDAPALAKLHPDYQKLEKDVRDDAEKYGKMGLPYVALLKLGWLF